MLFRSSGVAKDVVEMVKAEASGDAEVLPAKGETHPNNEVWKTS
jgi:hypothetical protein